MQTRFEFTLPDRETDEDNELYGERVEKSIMPQVEHFLKNKDDAMDQSEHEINVCESLTTFAEQKDSNIAYRILFEATQLQLGDKAKSIILQAFGNEKFVRSAFMCEPTLECIDQQKKRSSHIVTQFLSNPVWMLSWFEKAEAQEISRTICKHFKPNTTFWTLMKDNKDAELTPGFATICFSLINSAELNDEETNRLLAAFSNPQIPFADLPRVLASAQARIRLPASLIPDKEERKALTVSAIRTASGCFINTPLLSLTKADFSELKMNGAIFDRSSLIENKFSSCACKFAKFERCTLIGCDFSKSDASCASFARSDLTNVNFACTNLKDVNFSFAELSNVDFSEADFTGANFTGCKLSEKKNIFISREAFQEDNIEETFDRLYYKINGHEFMADLRAAIVRYLIDYCTACVKPHNDGMNASDNILPPDKAIHVLKIAYHHNLFAAPRTYKTLVKAVNTASEIGTTVVSTVLESRVVTSVTSWFGSTPAKENKTPAVTKKFGTDAQADIYDALENLTALEKDQQEAGQIDLSRRGSRRPPPPNYSPADDTTLLSGFTLK